MARPKPARPPVTVQLRLDPALAERLKAYAAEHKISMNAAARTLITSALQETE